MPVGTRKNLAPASPIKAPAHKRDQSPAAGGSRRWTRRKKGEVEGGNDSNIEFDVADECGIKEEDRQAGSKAKKPGSAQIATRR
ncbi:hypothetical protein EST38_g12723 [Candolleomyces aberdarensis]|uniref:Uncharacterized protein n=1 Tax=Candolleomyces aberdarensis TaxID=2316362 RepID=A0A4Q2D3Z8_9AGAR|nr:hypothetical protein EST38_g12723 [Candolleomyces aberdarensis]